MRSIPVKDHDISTGVDARKTAGYPEALKEVMMFISWEMGAAISTRVGNPPRIDITGNKLSTKKANIKTKTAPSNKTKKDLYITSPARGTILVDQETFGKTGSAPVPDLKKYPEYKHVTYPTTLRELFKYVEEGKLIAYRDRKDKNKLCFETRGDFQPVATGRYDDKGKLTFTKSLTRPSLMYSINIDDLGKTEIAGIVPVVVTDEDKAKLSPWKDSNALSSKSEKLLKKMGIPSDDESLDKPIPLLYKHGQMKEFKPLQVVAKGDAIVIGDDDTLSMSPSIVFLKYIKDKHDKSPENYPYGVHDLMKTMPNFNSPENAQNTADRLFHIEKLLFEFNKERLGNSLRLLEDPMKYYKDGKFAGIDSCGTDGMSAFELMISIHVNEKFKYEGLKHIGQFVQHPPEIRNHTFPSSLEEKAMHIWNGRFILTKDEDGLIAYYTQQNDALLPDDKDDWSKKFPLLQEHFVEVSPIWIKRSSNKWWPIIAIQDALGQGDLIDKDTRTAYNDYLKTKPALYVMSIEERAQAAERQLNERAKILALTDLINPPSPTASAISSDKPREEVKSSPRLSSH